MQQVLEALDVVDGVAQDLHLGQPLAGVGRGAAAQGLEGVVDLLEAAALAHSGGPTPVHRAVLALARLAGPLEAVARLVGPAAGEPDVLVLLRTGQLAAGPKVQTLGRGGTSAVVEHLGRGEGVHVGWAAVARALEEEEAGCWAAGLLDSAWLGQKGMRSLVEEA